MLSFERESDDRDCYERPLGCAHDRDVVTLGFEHGKVARVAFARWVTGEECQ